MVRWVGKFTCLAPETELRGVVTGVGAELGEGQVASTIDVRPDANYRHLLVAPPAPDSVHLEIYATDCGRPDDGDVDWRAATVLDPSTGERRDVRTGDRIRVLGSWVTDNHLHNDEAPARRTVVNGCERWVVKSEFHPYSKRSMLLLSAPARGQPVEQILTLVAPRFQQVFSYQWLLNQTLGLVDSRQRTSQVVDETLTTSAEARCVIEASPAPWLAFFYSLVLREEILRSSGEVECAAPTREGNTFVLRVTAQGEDPRNPAVFQAKYVAAWEFRLHRAARWLGRIIQRAWRGG